jgi:hypothetical protein
MTERWKEALRDLDDVGPDDSVYRRAEQGPTRSDLPPPPNRSTRIVAAVTAFAVFALAAVFAWQAFRPTLREELPPRSPTPSGNSASMADSGIVAWVDPLGWRVDLPARWSVTGIDTQGRVSTSGAAFSNVSPGVASPTSATPSPVGLDPDQMPSDAVEVVITHLEGGPMPDLTTDDTQFPITLDGLGCPLADMLLCGVNVRGGGLDFSIEVRRGPDASQEDVAAAEALVASMRFRAMRLGQQANGWASLGRPALYPRREGSPAWIGGRLGVVYVMRGTEGTYALDLDPDTCGEGQNQTWDPATLQIWVQCPDYVGIGDVRYDRFGRPDPNNAPRFQAPLEAYPVITSWDGSLLIYIDGSMDQLPQMYWP